MNLETQKLLSTHNPNCKAMIELQIMVTLPNEEKEKYAALKDNNREDFATYFDLCDGRGYDDVIFDIKEEDKHLKTTQGDYYCEEPVELVECDDAKGTIMYSFSTIVPAYSKKDNLYATIDIEEFQDTLQSFLPNDYKVDVDIVELIEEEEEEEEEDEDEEEYDEY